VHIAIIVVMRLKADIDTLTTAALFALYLCRSSARNQCSSWLPQQLKQKATASRL
jgi:hypothetical protein